MRKGITGTTKRDSVHMVQQTLSPRNSISDKLLITNLTGESIKCRRFPIIKTENQVEEGNSYWGFSQSSSKKKGNVQCQMACDFVII